MSAPSDRNALHAAAARGQIEVLRAALAAGAEVGLTDKDGRTPLHAAAETGEVEAARLLLEAGAPVEAKDKFGNTPLWKATFGNAALPELVEMLLAAGSDRDTTNDSGRSPLHMAKTFAKPGVVEHFQ